MSLPDLRADFAGRDEMAFWVHRAHYSHSLPASKLVGVGFRESGRSVGCVIFSRGASSEIHSPFSLQQSEVCELTRVAFGPHVTPTSRIVALAVRLLRRQSPGLRLIVSFADPEHQHLGVLYQAMNWLYLGQTNRESLIRLNGRLLHPRTVASRYRTRSIDWLREHVAVDAGHVRTLPKHRYVLPLDDDMRQQLAPRVQAYPKRPKVAGPCVIPAGLGGAMPTRPLHMFTSRQMSADAAEPPHPDSSRRVKCAAPIRRGPCV